MRTAPSATLARQVLHMPPRHEYGRSSPARRAASSTVSPSCIGTSVLMPSETMVASANAAAPGATTRRGRAAPGEAVNRSLRMRSGAKPPVARASDTSAIIPSGPHRKASSIRGMSSKPPSKARTRGPSSRPDNTGTSCCSRDRTCTTVRRPMKRSFSSSSASRKMMPAVARLPYSRTKRLPGSRVSTDFRMDSTGVMPDPAATPR